MQVSLDGGVTWQPDDCGDPWYHDHLTDVVNAKLCPKCKQEHEDAAVHSDSSET